jgi:hypothetical protein
MITGHGRDARATCSGASPMCYGTLRRMNMQQPCPTNFSLSLTGHEAA